MPTIPTGNRRSIRLKGYDYSLGAAYFVTLVPHKRKPLFGIIRNGQMNPNRFGTIVHQSWLDIPNHFPKTALDQFVLMPNHIHGIILITENKKGMACHAPTFGDPVPHSLPTIVGSFKSEVTKRMNEIRKTPGEPVWQRNYFERVIRNEKELTRIREYILNNPMQWETDRENPMKKVVNSKTGKDPWA
jgi:REP element-mobilizing transposase RayT